jgi:hypothetical protein
MAYLSENRHALLPQKRSFNKTLTFEMPHDFRPSQKEQLRGGDDQLGNLALPACGAPTFSKMRASAAAADEAAPQLRSLA